MILAGRRASGWRTVAKFTTNIKQSKISDISSEHKKADCFQNGGLGFWFIFDINSDNNNNNNNNTVGGFLYPEKWIEVR
jgi:hypothetical protein